MPKKKILLADDEEAIRTLLALTLKNVALYELLEARDGAEALAVARREIPDLILLDVLMPQPDGFDVCAQIKADPRTRHIPVILLTALTQDRHRLRGQQVGADGYFSKPFSPTALLQTINSFLNKSN